MILTGWEGEGSMEENLNDEIWHLSNSLLNDDRLSLKAKGLYFCIILSNDKKGLTLDMINKTSEIDSKRTIKMGINELEKAGYIIRNILQNGEIRWTYKLKRNINEETKLRANTSDVKKKPPSKKPQGKKSTRRRKTTKKSGLNHILGSFFKHFF
jgi:hypothetical protein